MFSWTPGNVSDGGMEAWAAALSPMETGEFLKRTAAHAFARFNSIGLALADEEPGDSVGDFLESQGLDWFSDGVQTDPEALRQAAESGISKEEMKASSRQWLRAMGRTEKEIDEGGLDGRIAWHAGMTRRRALLLLQEQDRRDREALLLDASADSAARKAAGFGAAMLAVMADPLNLVPLGGLGQAAKGARLGARVAAGMKAGAAGSVLADAAILPRAQALGEDAGFQAFALDTVFGAAFGAGFGLLGGALHARRRGKLDAEAASMAAELREAGLSAQDAAAASERFMDIQADISTGPERAMMDGLRTALPAAEREKLGLLLDRAALALTEGEPLDVGRWAEQLGMKEDFVRWWKDAQELAAAHWTERGKALSREAGEAQGMRPEAAAEAASEWEAWAHGPDFRTGRELPHDRLPEEERRAPFGMAEGGGLGVRQENSPAPSPLQEAPARAQDGGLADAVPGRDAEAAARPAEGMAGGTEGGEAMPGLDADGGASPAGRDARAQDGAAEAREWGGGLGRADPVEALWEQAGRDGSLTDEARAAVAEAEEDVLRAQRMEDAALELFACPLFS